MLPASVMLLAAHLQLGHCHNHSDGHDHSPTLNTALYFHTLGIRQIPTG